jgi:hypothetical protein
VVIFVTVPNITNLKVRIITDAFATITEDFWRARGEKLIND